MKPINILKKILIPSVLSAAIASVMTDSGSVNAENSAPLSFDIRAGESAEISEGYLNTPVTVNAVGLAEQSEGTAVPYNLLIGKTAWVNGKKITGTMPDYHAIDSVSHIPDSDDWEKAGITRDFDKGTYTIQGGYHKESVIRLPYGSAHDEDVRKGETYSTSGGISTGTMPDSRISVYISRYSQDDNTTYATSSSNTAGTEFVLSPDSANDFVTVTQGYNAKDRTITVAPHELTYEASFTEFKHGATLKWEGEKDNQKLLLDLGERHLYRKIDLTQIYNKGHDDGQDDTEGTAKEEDVLDTKTAWVDGIKVTGTMPDYPAIDETSGAKTTADWAASGLSKDNSTGIITIADGYHKESKIIGASGEATDDKVLSGTTYSSKTGAHTGSMPYSTVTVYNEDGTKSE